MIRGNVFGVCVAALLVQWLSLRSTGAQSQDVKLPEGEGREMVTAACTPCHGLATVAEDNRTRSGWEDVVDEMKGLGAKVTDRDTSTVVTYLWRSFGRVNVNRASQQDIQNVVGLSSSEAAAIIEYRIREGDFHELEDLRKVSGLDFTKIQEHKNNIAFTGE
jgi:competence protein ComEA